MSVTAADIKGLPSAEFSSLADGIVTPFIAEAELEVSEDVWGDYVDEGVKYLAAHLLAVMLLGSRGPSGPVVSETAGSLSRSYAAPQVSTDSLLSTVYGRRYADLRRIVAGGPQVL